MKGEIIFQELEFLKYEKSGIKVSGQSNIKGFFQCLFFDKRKLLVFDIDEDLVMVERCEKVKVVMLYVWICYEKYVWGMDEFKVCKLYIGFCVLKFVVNLMLQLV